VEKLTEVDPRVRVMNDHPANLVNDLLEGRADVALIPVVHLFNHPELKMIEGLGVAADGPVKSVLLKCNVPLEQIKRVARDPASATSNALLQVLFPNVEMVEDQAADAAVVIGDRALCSNPAPAGDIDLSEAWKKITGLPFVFAVWAVRKDFPALGTVSKIAHKAFEAGFQSLEKIAERYAAELGHPPSFWMAYLGNTIHYELNADDMQGLARFRELLWKA
jgi:chorismate dehydratase